MKKTRELLNEFLEYIKVRTWNEDSDFHKEIVVNGFLDSYQPERLNPETCFVPAEHFVYIDKEKREKCPCKTCKRSIEIEKQDAIV